MKHSESYGIDRLVLICIADETGDNGRCHLESLASVCRKANLHPEDVITSIYRLVDLGELVYIQRSEVPIRFVALDRSASRAAKAQGLPSHLSKALRRSVGDRDGWVCVYCHAVLSETPDETRGALKATLDHVVARSRGGGEELNNLVLACRSCNSRKGARPVEQMSGVYA